MITRETYEEYYTKVMKEMFSTLVGPNVIAKAPELPMGTQHVTMVGLKNLKGKARVGQKGAPIPRELGEVYRKSVPILGHAHGFEIEDQDLKASERGTIPLPMAGAVQCARVIGESVERTIFNGRNPEGVKGLYTDAKKTFKSLKPWNIEKGNPYNDIVEAIGLLSDTGNFKPKKLVLSSGAYYNLVKANDVGITSMKLILDSELFPNGKNDILLAPVPSTLNAEPIIPVDGGLLCDFGPGIAERYVQKTAGDFYGNDADNPYEGDISLTAFPMDPNDLWRFNLKTYQGLDIHHPEAFVKLEGLIKT